MKKYLFLLSVFFLFISFTIAQNQASDEVNRDEMFVTAFSKVQKGRDNIKNLEKLKQAYHEANQADHERILLLRKSGQPDIWPEVYKLYQKIDNREKMLVSLPQTTIEQINVPKIDLSLELASSRQKSALFLMTQASELLSSGNRDQANDAFSLLVLLKEIDPDFPNLDANIMQALIAGARYKLLRIRNETGSKLPGEFVDKAMRFGASDAIQIDTYPNPTIAYDQLIEVVIQKIEISPEKTETTDYTEKKILDDATGQTVEAQVKEIVLRKNIQLNGEVNFLSGDGNHQRFSVPIVVQSGFVYNFAEIKGDSRACSDRVIGLKNNKKVPFPQNTAMLLVAADQLNKTILKILVGSASDE